MNIADLRDGLRNVEATGMIVDIVQPARDVSLKTGGSAKVTTATLMDEAGAKVALSLWDGQIAMVKKGDHVKISNGYMNAFKDEPQLNVGRYGKLEIIAP